MSLIAKLRDEHERFRKRLLGWDDLLVELESGIGTFATLRLKEEANWVFSEVLPHIEAEESIIFSLLPERIPDSLSTIQRLRDDHFRLRALIDQLTELAWKRQLGTATNLQAKELLKTFRWRLLDHLAREDGALPPLLMQTLNADENNELVRRWQGQIDSIAPQAVTPSKPSIRSLTDLNGSIHAFLNELLLRHLEALTALDLNAARFWWHKFSNALTAHSRAEDDVALPVYERIGDFPEGGHPSLFNAEHKGIERMLRSLEQRLDILSPNDPSLRRRIVVSLDRYMLLRHLVEHHTLREQNILYPILDERADGEAKERIRSAFQASMPSDFAR